MTSLDITVMNEIMRYHSEHGFYPPRFEVEPHLLQELTRKEFVFQVPGQEIPYLFLSPETHAPIVTMHKTYKTVTVPVVPVGKGYE